MITLRFTNQAVPKLTNKAALHPVNVCVGGGKLHPEHAIQRYGITKGYSLAGALSKDGDTNGIHVAGKINSSQDGVVVFTDGCTPCHTAGHGNCPKIIIEY